MISCLLMYMAKIDRFSLLNSTYYFLGSHLVCFYHPFFTRDKVNFLSPPCLSNCYRYVIPVLSYSSFENWQPVKHTFNCYRVDAVTYYDIILNLLFQIRALGTEGMIQEMLRYLNIAENILQNVDPYQRTDMYNIVLRALIKAKDVSGSAFPGFLF